MRKYIKSMREQFDNNSVIFNQAKRMFHYDPQVSQRHPSRRSNRQQQRFRDDCSTVKEGKNQYQSINQINQSSWIAKLVNGIQEHSLQDDILPQNKPQTKDFRSIRSQNVVVITQQDDEPAALKNITNQIEKQESKNKVQQLTKPVINLEKRFPPKGRQAERKARKLSRNASQQQSKSQGKTPISRKKQSVENSHQNSKSTCSVKSKQSIQKKSERQPNIRIDQSWVNTEEVKCVTETKEKEIVPEALPDSQEHFYQPLFQTASSFSTGKVLSSGKGRVGCGSIRKNSRPVKEIEREKQPSAKAMASPTFQSESKAVTAREERTLVQKYLKRDYASRVAEKYGKEQKKYSYDIGQEERQKVSVGRREDRPYQMHECCLDKQQIRLTGRPFIQKKPDRPERHQIGYQRQYFSREEAPSSHTYSHTHKERHGGVQNNQNITPTFSPFSTSFRPLTANEATGTISRTAYLQADSIMSENQHKPCMQTSLDSTGIHRKHSVPSKYSYLVAHSGSKEDSNSSRHRSSHRGSEQPDCMIDRLNSKLTSYIEEHRLADQQEPGLEETHRAMHLTFNQLKKHCGFRKK